MKDGRFYTYEEFINENVFSEIDASKEDVKDAIFQPDDVSEDVLKKVVTPIIMSLINQGIIEEKDVIETKNGMGENGEDLKETLKKNKIDTEIALNAVKEEFKNPTK